MPTAPAIMTKSLKVRGFSEARIVHPCWGLACKPKAKTHSSTNAQAAPRHAILHEARRQASEAEKRSSMSVWVEIHLLRLRPPRGRAPKVQLVPPAPVHRQLVGKLRPCRSARARTVPLSIPSEASSLSLRGATETLQSCAWEPSLQWSRRWRLQLAPERSQSILRPAVPISQRRRLCLRRGASGPGPFPAPFAFSLSRPRRTGRVRHRCDSPSDGPPRSGHRKTAMNRGRTASRSIRRQRASAPSRPLCPSPAG